MPRTKEQFDSIKNESKSKIRNAGLKLFIEKGLPSTSVSEIASAAGISKGLMYHYYKSKDDLYYELIEDAVNASRDYMLSFLDAEMSPAEKIRQVSRTMIEDIYKNDEFVKFFVFIVRSMLTSNVSEKRSGHFRNAFAAFDIMESIIVEGQKTGSFKSGNPKEMSVLYWSAINGLCANKLIMGQSFPCPSSKLLDEIILKE